MALHLLKERFRQPITIHCAAKPEIEQKAFYDAHGNLRIHAHQNRFLDERIGDLGLFGFRLAGIGPSRNRSSAQAPNLFDLFSQALELWEGVFVFGLFAYADQNVGLFAHRTEKV